MDSVVDVESILSILKELPFLKEFRPSGENIQVRNAVINLCPIGRSANLSAREVFIAQAVASHWRSGVLEQLQKLLEPGGCDVALGGQTSFDVYPKNWDKSFVLKHCIPDLFVGDALGFTG